MVAGLPAQRAACRIGRLAAGRVWGAGGGPDEAELGPCSQPGEAADQRILDDRQLLLRDGQVNDHRHRRGPARSVDRLLVWGLVLDL